MNARTLTVITHLLDLKAAAFDLLRSRHRNPALLNLYTFIDICASLSNSGKKQNRDIFESYLKTFSTFSKWERYTPYELWAARSSLLHSYSPFGYHTEKEKSPARPIFYFSWPEKEAEIQLALEGRGYSNFLLLDVQEIKHLAVDTFNTMHRKIELEPEFETLFLKNAQNILPSLYHMRLEDELSFIQEFTEHENT